MLRANGRSVRPSVVPPSSMDGKASCQNHHSGPAGATLFGNHVVGMFGRQGPTSRPRLPPRRRDGWFIKGQSTKLQTLASSRMPESSQPAKVWPLHSSDLDVTSPHVNKGLNSLTTTLSTFSPLTSDPDRTRTCNSVSFTIVASVPAARQFATSDASTKFRHGAVARLSGLSPITRCQAKVSLLHVRACGPGVTAYPFGHSR